MSEHEPRDFLEVMASDHDIDLDTAITAVEAHPDSELCVILAEREDHYLLVSRGTDRTGHLHDDEAMQIPKPFLGQMQGLLHAAGLHQSENELAREDGQEPLDLRSVAEGMGITTPMGDQDGR